MLRPPLWMHPAEGAQPQIIWPWFWVGRAMLTGAQHVCQEN